LVFNQNIRIITPYPISSDDVIAYINAADVLVLVSLKEGSPNVIKEAMACNCPIVSTDVGDVRWVFGETDDPVFSGKTPLSDPRDRLRLLQLFFRYPV